MKRFLTTFAVFLLGSVAFTVSGQTGVWTTNAAMSPRAFGAAATVSNKVYMIGGGNYSCGVVSTLQAYNPVSNTWANLTSMPTARYELCAAELNGLIYAIEGNPGCGSAGQAMATVEAYNPVSNSWSTRAPLPTGGWGAGAVGINGKVYVIGGFNANVYCYDPVTNGWSLRTPAPATVAFGLVAAVDGIIYAIGGAGAGSNVFAYNPVADTWTTKTHMPTMRDEVAGAVVNGIIYVTGGANSSGLQTKVEAYNPATDTWSTEPSLPYQLFAASAAAVNGTLYVMGGFNAANATLGTVLSFTPSPVLTNIVITPGNPIVGVGTNQSFAATGYYNNGSSQVLTNGSNGTNLLWSSSNPIVASINTNGIATGLSNGVTTISATSGSVSGSATLTVVSSPSISVAPTNNTVSPGGSVTLSVAATGGGLSYQWQFNGTNIPGANSASLTLTNILSSSIGVYTVIVSNPAGSISTSVMVATFGIQMFAGVILYGPLGSNYLIQACSNLSSSWVTLTNIALPTQPYIYIDYSSPGNGQQFYRAIPQ
jgi:N-acetylneuraminic acid mutarotase